jgi:nucleoside-triphosphatase
MKEAYLLTGSPGVGKTTLIREVLSRTGARAGGFYTQELRGPRGRLGFEIVTLEGERAVLSHVDFPSPYRVSKYGVDLEALDRVGVGALRQALQEREVVVVDEIGKMELLSTSFREAVLAALESDKKVLGTILLSPHPFADTIKKHPRVRVLTLSRVNYQKVASELLQWLSHPAEAKQDRGAKLQGSG